MAVCQWTLEGSLGVGDRNRVEAARLDSAAPIAPGAEVGPSWVVGAGPVEKVVTGPLSQYRPLRWELVRTPAPGRQWRQGLLRHHYLGAPGLVGANLRCLVYGRAGERLGALGWQSAGQPLGCRDRLLGGTAAQREQ